MQVLINPLVISITYPLCESQHKISTVRSGRVVWYRETKSKALCRMGQLREALEEQQITTQMQWQSLNVIDNKAVVLQALHNTAARHFAVNCAGILCSL